MESNGIKRSQMASDGISDAIWCHLMPNQRQMASVMPSDAKSASVMLNWHHWCQIGVSDAISASVMPNWHQWSQIGFSDAKSASLMLNRHQWCQFGVSNILLQQLRELNLKNPAPLPWKQGFVHGFFCKWIFFLQFSNPFKAIWCVLLTAILLKSHHFIVG